jgi:Lon protease-like protein
MGNIDAADFPEHIGLMVLPWVSLFPGGLLPLRIFEERYREMIQDALNHHRMFGIAHSSEDDESELDRIATLGVVRACIKNEDGTSNLILQGLARVKLSNVLMEPYPSADITVLPDSEATSRETKMLRESIEKHLIEDPAGQKRLPKGFADHLVSVDSSPTFADLVASTAVLDPVHRRLLLEELDVCSRMRMLLDCLLKERAMLENEEP